MLFGACQVRPNGSAFPNGSLEIGLGKEWAFRHVTVIRRGLQAIVIDTWTGETIRELTIDPARRYQPTGRPRGGPLRPPKV